MKRILLMLVFVFVMFFVCMPQAYATDVDVTLEWNQVLSPDFAGWRLWYGLTSGGPYSQLGSDIVYDGTPLPSYSSVQAIDFPAGAETTIYIVATAYDNEVPENESGYSNEVSKTVDFLAPDSPTNLKITMILKFLKGGINEQI